MDLSELLTKTEIFRPRILNLMITERCNYRCRFCDFHNKNREMPFELAVRVINEAQRSGIKTAAFTGGEPLLYKGIYDLVSLIKTLGMSPHITTNGSLIYNNWKRLLDSGLDSISFSIDGIGEVHDNLRGVKGSFESIKNGIETLYKNNRMLLFVNMVVTNQNVSQIIKVYQFAKSYNATFFFWPVNDTPDLYMNDDNADEYYRAVEYICSKESCSSCMRKFLIKGLDYHQGRIKRFRCPAFFSTVNIYLDGEVMPCCVWNARDLSAGNVNEKSLIDILSSDKAKEIVKGIFQSGCYNRCYNSMLPEFSELTGEDFIL
ncbi:MAG: radical SAM protein [Myxococcota bacterium]